MDRPSSFDHRFLAMALAFAFVGLAAACDSGTQEPDAPAASNEFGANEAAPQAGDSSAAAPTAPPRDGSIAAERFVADLPEGITAEIPHNFPSSIPIYPGAQPSQGAGVERDGSPVSGVQLLSNDSPGEIYGFYEDELRANGWDITASTNDPMMSTISATQNGCQVGPFIKTSPQGGSDIFVMNEC